MTACRPQKDRLLDYALGTLPAAAASEVQKHLQRCPACAAAFASLRSRRQQMDAALAQLAGGAEPSRDFRARVLAAAESSAAVGIGRAAWVGAGAAVAILVLAATALSWLVEPQPRPRTRVSLSEWRSPTESLLRSPAEELLRSTPRLAEFYFSLESAPAGVGEDNGGNDES